MDVGELLVVSDYVRAIKREGGYCVYHTLFGNLCFLDNDGYALLRYFEKPRQYKDVLSLNGYNQFSIINYISLLLNKCFLRLYDSDEELVIKEISERRKKNLSKGYLLQALQLVMTNLCNYSCEYCFVNSLYSSDDRLTLTKDKNIIMDFETASKSIHNVLEIIRSNNNKKLFIEFFGGEPLLNWKTIKQALRAYGNGFKDDVDIFYSITTNGSMLSYEIADTLRSYNTTVTLSIDTYKHEACSNLAGEENSLIKNKLQILKDCNNYVTLNTLLTKSTINKFSSEELIELASDYNVAMIGIILDLNMNYYDNPDFREKVVNKLYETHMYGKQAGIPVVGYWYQIFQQISGERSTHFTTGYRTCPAEGCKLSVEPGGQVFNCKCCSTKMGNINNLKEVLNSKAYESYAMKVYSSNDFCKGCEIEGFCSGVCMGTLENKYKSINKIEPGICEIYKSITKLLIESISKDDMPQLLLSNVEIENVK